MTTIFLLQDPTNIQQIKELIAKYTDSKVFALNYFTHKILVKNTIDHEIGESYINQEDRIKVDDSAIQGTINWGTHKTIEDLLTFQGINLANLLEQEMWQYLAPFYLNAMQIIRIIEKEKPNTIVAETQLNDFIRRIGESTKINVFLIDKVEKSSFYHDKINIKFNIGKLAVSFYISRNQFMKIKKIVEKLINRPFTLSKNLSKKSILLVDFNIASYDALIKELGALNKNILLLNQRRPVIWNLKSFKIIRNSRCKIIRLEEFEKKLEREISESSTALSDKLSKIWNSDIIFEEIFKMNSYTFWYSIKESFQRICNSRLQESIRRIILLNELFQRFDISAILEWAETGQEEKELLHVSKKNGIQSVNLQHALMTTSEDWDKYHRFVLGFSTKFMSNKQAVWGELTKKRAMSFGYNEKDILITGSPRHDKFFNSVKIKKDTGIILLATTGVSGGSAENSPFESYIKFENCIREVCRVAKLFPEKRLVVRPHPHAEFLSGITELLHEIDPNIQIIHSANIMDLINSCDLLITFNNSTIVLESMMLEKPTISLLIEEWAKEEEIIKMGALMGISNIHDIEDGMRKMLYDSEFKNIMLRASRQFIENYFSNRGTASKVLAKTLDEF